MCAFSLQQLFTKIYILKDKTLSIHTHVYISSLLIGEEMLSVPTGDAIIARGKYVCVLMCFKYTPYTKKYVWRNDIIRLVDI